MHHFAKRSAKLDRLPRPRCGRTCSRAGASTGVRPFPPEFTSVRAVGLLTSGQLSAVPGGQPAKSAAADRDPPAIAHLGRS